MTSSKRTADAIALLTLFVVALVTNLGLAAWTEVEPVVRWLLTAVAGAVAAAVAYAISTRTRRSRDGRR